MMTLTLEYEFRTTLYTMQLLGFITIPVYERYYANRQDMKGFTYSKEKHLPWFNEDFLREQIQKPLRDIDVESGIHVEQVDDGVLRVMSGTNETLVLIGRKSNIIKVNGHVCSSFKPFFGIKTRYDDLPSFDHIKKQYLYLVMRYINASS